MHPSLSMRHGESSKEYRNYYLEQSDTLGQNAGVMLPQRNAQLESLLDETWSLPMAKKKSQKLPSAPRTKGQQENPTSVGCQDTIPGEELLGALASLRSEPKYSDLTISCDNETYPVHRCIVCTRSAFFARACDGDFKEASTGVITLNEDPALVKMMIEYLYTLDYDVEPTASSDNCISHEDTVTETSELPIISENTNLPSETERERSPANITEPFGSLNPSINPIAKYNALSFHILMYSLADRLFIDGLKALATEYVELELVQQLDANSFPKAISEIYLSTPPHDRGLRDLAIRTTMKHMTTLRNSTETTTAALQNSLLESLPQYSHDLLVAIIDRSMALWNQDNTIRRNWVESSWSI
ncbi:hypothetical protein P168DRAFT_282969 [Aspergillus campestris IBT 28561]|uniref:BTB domain-containing protein n=1 Tax=Aspergillus campestris (strain IBT 28561) TaxID=1392248 RepID=A0A2I1D012_ASPC2|nr:uncharacterized protein P168DRAFT_282969 [Aspergillus campestris IBT 28561]PKY03214.1 hypothetical protein P168DRAFT_282969 [Aspergillus campestris IBT 28561]